VVMTDHGINLPIAKAGFFRNDSGAFINADTVSDLSPLILGAVLLLAFLVALSKMLIQRTAMALVGPDMLIDAFMADGDALLVFLTILIFAQDSSPSRFWPQSEESVLPSFSGLWPLVSCAYRSLSVPVLDGSLACLYSASILEKSLPAIHPARSLSLSDFFLLYLISQSGIFVPGLAVYSFSYAFSSLVGLKKT